MIRRAVLLLGLVGAVVFGGALLVSFTQPLLIERAMREVLRVEVERRVGEALEGPADASLAALARFARAQSDPQARYIIQAIRDELPRRVEDVVEKMLDPNCFCRQRMASAAEEAGLGNWMQRRGRLRHFIEAAYGHVNRQMMREFRIFTGSNAVAFALLALVAFVRRKANAQLLLPALVLVGAVALTGGLYVFNQDWLHTIVFGDYLGWGYAAYLSCTALLLADILLNRARVSTHIVNAVGSVIGSAATAVPC